MRTVLSEFAIPAAVCHAHGDHHTDLPMLPVVGDPVVVGDEPLPADRAYATEWPRLPGAVARTVRRPADRGPTWADQQETAVWLFPDLTPPGRR